jgi:uncharacterized membrane protein
MAKDIVPTSASIAAMAREQGVSRSTIRRRMANQARPPAAIEGEIIKQNQEVTMAAATPATSLAVPIAMAASDWPPHTPTPGLRWRSVGRAVTGLAVAGCGAAIAVTSIRANAWFGRSLTTDPTAGEIFSSLSVLAEITACVIPTANRFYWQDGDRWTALRGFILMAVALTVVFFAASGFVPNTISTGVENRGDRVTPAVELAQRVADTLARSRAENADGAASAAGTLRPKSARHSLT